MIFFLTFFSVILQVVNTSNSFIFSGTWRGKRDFCRQQGTFEIIKKGFSLPAANFISSLNVESWLECGQSCLQHNKCSSFYHRSSSSATDINCQLSNEDEKESTTTQNNYGDWTFYKMQSIKSPICSKKNLPCQNGGKCIVDFCVTDGYACLCPENYIGKFCEFNKTNDYDVKITKSTPTQYIKIAVTQKSINQFTLSTWFRISPGRTWYKLLNYYTKKYQVGILVHFRTQCMVSTYKYGSICAMDVKLFNKKEQIPMIPLNDGYWHHLGLTWSNERKELVVLVDGVLRANLTELVGISHIPDGGLLIIGQRLKSNLEISNANNFEGEISQFNIWDRALSGFELERMAKMSGNESGNFVNWFDISEYVSDGTEIVTPSTAESTVGGMNYNLDLDKTKKGHVSVPAPLEQLTEITACMWISTSVSAALLFSSKAFSMRFDNNGYFFAHVNQSFAKSDSASVKINDLQWHFVCTTWNGDARLVKFYIDGKPLGEAIQFGAMNTSLYLEGNFTIGVDSKLVDNVTYFGFVGMMSQLNIWKVFLNDDWFRVMSAGGVNVNGNILAWRSVINGIIGIVDVTENSDIFLPGYSVLSKRTKWCNDNFENEQGELYARLGASQLNATYSGMIWRCYRNYSIDALKMIYKFGAKGYFSRHRELLAITD